MIENIEQRTAIYIPAYSDGLTKLFYNNTDKDIANYELSDFKEKKSLRIYSDADSYFKNPWMLISAGVQYDKKDVRKKIGAEKAKVFVDSGGFQLAMGTVNANKFTDKVALEWSEKNGDIFPILDRPVRNLGPDKPLKTYEECLEKSVASAKYYYENRSRSDALVLNVLQGQHKKNMEDWYKHVKDYQFDGWGMGGTAGLYGKMLTGLLVLLNNGELEKEKCKVVHIFGVSSNLVMLYLKWTQRVLNGMGIDVQLTYDSTYWNRSTVFGGFFMGPRWRPEAGMEQIKLTNRQIVPDENVPKGKEIIIDGIKHRAIPQDYTNLGRNFKLPCDCPVCSDLIDTYSFFNNYEKDKQPASYPADPIKDDGETKLQMHKFNVTMAFHNLYHQMKYNDYQDKILDVNQDTLGGPLDSLLKEIFGAKVFNKLGVIKKVLENPKNPMNYDTLYEDFKHQHLKEKSDTVNALDV